MSRWLHVVALLAVSAALVASGCGEDDGSTAAAGGETTQTEAAPVNSKPEKKKPKITVVNSTGVPGVGMGLVNSRWYVLYEFSLDEGKKSACYGACAKEWPPLLTNGRKNLFVGAGASEVSLGTTKRKGGAIQVTYAGHPAYSYVGDKRRWHAKGDGVRAFGGVFHGIEDPNFD